MIDQKIAFQSFQLATINECREMTNERFLDALELYFLKT